MRKPAVLGLLGLFVSLAPALAGTVYVPVASPQKVGDVSYRTQIVLGNPGAAAQRLTTVFIPSGQDGTRVQTAAPSTATVPGKGTLILANAAPAGRQGMLEISGSSQIAVTARLEAVSGGRVLSSVTLPVVGADNLVAPGATAQLQGIGRAASGVEHRFGLINLGSAAAACTVSGFRADGSPLGTSGLTVPPRSHNAVQGPLSALGARLFTDARLEVKCDAPFFAYALQLSRNGSTATAVSPSVTLQSGLQTLEEMDAAETLEEIEGGAEDLEVGEIESEEGPTSAEVAAAVVTGPDSLFYEGLFLNARRNDSYRAFELPLRPGVRYKKITVDFDLYLHRWVNPLFHVVTALRRNDRTLYAGLILRGDRQKTVLDLGKDELVRDVGPWKPRSRYHIRMVTDAQTRRVTLQVLQKGRIVHTLTGPLTTPDLSVTSQTRMRVDFGGTKVADGAYFPPVGWKYMNLRVKAEPF